ncbi:MAG: glycosyltransferase family 2 protein [Acidimicrobiales bacterium]|nr:glycosyltransferase family 2 protein [Acidimicrobiales bacterium]
MSAPAFRDLSFVVPAWNEEEMLERTVRAMRTAGERLVASGWLGDFEMVIVDDASTDRTGAMLDALAADDPRVRPVHHERNRGLGGSIRSGFAASRGELVLYTDADLPFDLTVVERAVRLLDEYEVDIISMYRFDRTGEGPRRLVYSYVYNSMIQAMLGLRVRDVNFAGKLLRRCVLDEVDLRSEGSFIDVELLARAQRRGFELLQFGVDYFPRSRGVSTLSSGSVIVGILRELQALRTQLLAVEALPRTEIEALRASPTGGVGG